MSVIRDLQLPLARDSALDLKLGEMVRVSGEITVSIGLPTHKRLAEAAATNAPLPVDLRGGAFFHLSTYVKDTPEGAVPLYINPSTSTRYNAFMPAIIGGLGVRLAGGKGGLDEASAQAMRESGCVYLSFLGGGAHLLSQALRRVVAMNWTEYISQFRLLTLEVEKLGPATVAIDAHGNSLYSQLHERAAARLPDITRALGHR